MIAKLKRTPLDQLLYVELVALPRQPQYICAIAAPGIQPSRGLNSLWLAYV